ncbi:hypothetical protein HG531_010785 [Fusarium graminearum]|nr:hypothetical protein HG531_010785 [Fusarium graminearum]
MGDKQEHLAHICTLSCEPSIVFLHICGSKGWVKMDQLSDSIFEGVLIDGAGELKLRCTRLAKYRRFQVIATSKGKAMGSDGDVVGHVIDGTASKNVADRKLNTLSAAPIDNQNSQDGITTKAKEGSIIRNELNRSTKNLAPCRCEHHVHWTPVCQRRGRVRGCKIEDLLGKALLKLGYDARNLLGVKELHFTRGRAQDWMSRLER